MTTSSLNIKSCLFLVSNICGQMLFFFYCIFSSTICLFDNFEKLSTLVVFLRDILEGLWRDFYVHVFLVIFWCLHLSVAFKMSDIIIPCNNKFLIHHYRPMTESQIVKCLSLHGWTLLRLLVPFIIVCLITNHLLSNIRLLSTNSNLNVFVQCSKRVNSL